MKNKQAETKLNPTLGLARHLFGSVLCLGAFILSCSSASAQLPRAIVTDFNGDGKPDFLLYNVSTRQTAIWYLNNNVHIGSALGPTLPVGWELAGVADFNRDGHPDYLLFNATTRRTAIWYLAVVTRVAAPYGPTIPAVWVWQLAATTDFNGDGKPDYVLYKGTTGQTAIWYLSNNVHIASAAGPTVPAGGWSLAEVCGGCWDY